MSGLVVCSGRRRHNEVVLTGENLVESIAQLKRRSPRTSERIARYCAQGSPVLFPGDTIDVLFNDLLPRRESIPGGPPVRRLGTDFLTSAKPLLEGDDRPRDHCRCLARRSEA